MHIQIEQGRSSQEWVVFQMHNGEPSKVKMFLNWQDADDYALKLIKEGSANRIALEI